MKTLDIALCCVLIILALPLPFAITRTAASLATIQPITEPSEFDSTQPTQERPSGNFLNVDMHGIVWSIPGPNALSADELVKLGAFLSLVQFDMYLYTDALAILMAEKLLPERFKKEKEADGQSLP